MLDRRCSKRKPDPTEEYREWRRKTNRLCKRKKRESMKKQSEEINELNQDERRKFYKAVNNMKRAFQPRMSGCKGKDGKTIAEKKEILERWTEHFAELMKEQEEKEEKEKQ